MPDAAEEGLLERGAELAALEAALEGLGDAGALVVVEGAAGIGKSRLLAELRERARGRGLRVAEARCTQLERPFAFGAVRQLLGPLAGRAAFAGAAAHARPLFDGSAESSDSTAADGLFARLHGLYWMCAELTADAPLVLIVDDLQWADAGSLAFVAFLRSRLAGHPLLLAVASRPTPEPLINELLSDPAACALRPRALTEAAVAHWVAAQFGGEPDPAFATACARATGGNPLLLRELLREAAAEGLAPDADDAARLEGIVPRGVTSVVAVRLSRVAPAALVLARAVAVLGDGTTVEEVAELAEVDNDAVPRLVAELVAADLLAAGPALAFTHPIVRAAVLEEQPAVMRAALHRSAAGLLRARGAPADRIASQLLAAGGAADPADVELLRSAAAMASGLGDQSAAAAFLRACLPAVAGHAHADTLLALAAAEARNGEASAAERLRGVLTATTDPERRARAAIALARLASFAGSPEQALDVLEASERELASGSPTADAVAAEILGAAHITRSAARRLAGRLAALAEPAGDARTIADRMALGALAFNQAVEPGGSALEAARLARRALAGEAVVTDPVLGGQIVVIVGLVLTLAGEHAEADAVLRDGLDAARRSGSAAGVAAFGAMRSLPLLRSGRLAAAEADAREALDLGQQVPTAGTLGHCALAVAVEALLERGAEPAECEALLAGGGITLDLDILPASLVLLARGRVALAGGDAEAALEHYRACDLPDPRWGRDSPALVPWRSGAALALLASGERAEAAALAAEEVALAAAFGAPAPHGAALRVAALAGPAQERAAGLRAAVERLTGADAALELARARVDLGAELRRAGERSAARAELEAALPEAARCGAVRLAAQAREELAALGVRPPRSVAEGRPLTPGERRVAMLAAQGLRNRDIAQRLFVTEKTVETHLSATYRKLGLRTRGQLVRALSDLG